MSSTTRPLAVVTGASSGIGLELALECARNGFDLVLAADRPLRAAADAVPTETDFFDRAELKDTKLGSAKKDDPAMVARVGFKAMMDGEGDVVAGLKNKLQAAVANVTPSSVLAEQHRKQAEPGSARH